MTTAKKMLEVQQFLEQKSLKNLAEEHGIYAKFSKKNPHKFSLNYDQIESKSGSRIVEECRGLILATPTPIASEEQIVGPTEIVACPFFRFYNHGDPAAAPIDWSKATFWSKLDGTLCIVHWDEHQNSWCVATRQVPDADVLFDGEKTFRDLFDIAWASHYPSHKPLSAQSKTGDVLHYEFTYMFELCTPENEQVVKHLGYSLFLLGARSKETLAETRLNGHYGLFWIPPNWTDLDEDNCFEWVESKDPRTNEGLVVCDENFNRVKIKSAAYKAAHRLKDKTTNSPRSILELILLKQDDDCRDLLDAKRIEILDSQREDLRNLIHVLNAEFDANVSPNRKEFAIAVQRGTGLLGPQMWRWQNRDKSYHDWLKSNMRENQYPDSFLDNLLVMMKKVREK